MNSVPAAYIIWQSAFFFFIGLTLVGLFSFYVIRKLQTGKWRENGKWRSPSTNAGIAMLVYFFGTTVVFGMLLWHRLAFPAAVPIDWQADALTLIGGTAITMVGATCLLRVFADYTWQGWAFAWLWCIVGAIVASSAIVWWRIM